MIQLGWEGTTVTLKLTEHTSRYVCSKSMHAFLIILHASRAPRDRTDFLDLEGSKARVHIGVVRLLPDPTRLKVPSPVLRFINRAFWILIPIDQMLKSEQELQTILNQHALLKD